MERRYSKWINDKVNNSAEFIFRMVTTKILIAILIPHLIKYNKKKKISI